MTGYSRPDMPKLREAARIRRRAAPGAGLRDRKKGKSVKPVVKTEISDEEVQKQIKDMLARLTSKGSKFKTAKHRRDKREAVSARLSEEMERQEAGEERVESDRSRYGRRAWRR